MCFLLYLDRGLLCVFHPGAVDNTQLLHFAVGFPQESCSTCCGFSSVAAGQTQSVGPGAEKTRIRSSLLIGLAIGSYVYIHLSKRSRSRLLQFEGSSPHGNVPPCLDVTEVESALQILQIAEVGGAFVFMGNSNERRSSLLLQDSISSWEWNLLWLRGSG